MLSYLSEDDNCDFEFGPLQKIASEIEPLNEAAADGRSRGPES